ncbi:MAG: hypothetical protein JXR91_12655 [Deltaproteobacteria bacterium]|nr:hypothetical protein [Deltaproteobacteria bacterium]
MKKKLLIGFLLSLFLTSCTGDETPGAGGAIDCPGVDGTYYYVTIGQGDCASQGVTLDDTGSPVQDGGVLIGGYSNCSQKVSYDGCKIDIHLDCSTGLSADITQTFKPGTPNIVKGSQTQYFDGELSCVYEIYGSTDKAKVLEYGGLSDTTDVSDISTPGTPDPENESVALTDCTAKEQAYLKTCPDDTADVEREAAFCVEDWQRYDAMGCGDAWLAYINCYTENAADIDCETGELPACDVYQNAYFQCTSAFASATGCSVAGVPETLCVDGAGTYSYGCLGGTAPFSDCTEVDTLSAAPMFCCF